MSAQAPGWDSLMHSGGGLAVLLLNSHGDIHISFVILIQLPLGHLTPEIFVICQAHDKV